MQELVASHAMLERMSQNEEATIVFHVCLRADCCEMNNLSVSFALPYSSLRKTAIKGSIAPQADITMG